MKISDFKKEEHSNILIKLSKENGMPLLDSIFLPEIGYVIDDVAVCFLYKTDSAICFFENLIISPRVRKAERTKVFNLMATTLIDRAIQEGFKIIWGVSDGVNVPLRLKHHKFEYRNVKFFIRSI